MKEYKFKINGNEYNVAIEAIEGGKASVSVNGTAYTVDIAETSVPATSAKSVRPAPARTVSAAPAAAPVAAPAVAAGGKKIVSPLPGVILALDVREGQAVKRGQRIAVLEAMKMENDILAECDGTISQICVHTSDSVLEGATIAVID